MKLSDMKPDSSGFLIKSLAEQGHDDIVTGTVNVLGDHYKISGTSRDSEGLKIELSGEPLSDKPICFRIEIL